MDVCAPIDSSKMDFDGFICCGSDFYRLTIHKSQNSDGFPRVECDWRLRQKLKTHMNFIKTRLEGNYEIDKFIKELKLLLAHTPDKSAKFDLKRAQLVISQLKELSLDKLIELDDSFTKIQLKAVDIGDRTHHLLLSIPENFPTARPCARVLLPATAADGFEFAWASGSTLAEVYRQFTDELGAFQQFWEEVEEIEENMWVVEPEQTNHATTNYQIALGEGCSMLLKLEPFQLSSAPDVSFMGPDKKTAEIRQRFYEGVDEWTENLSVYQNLKKILQIDFPQSSSGRGGLSQDRTLFCGICFSFRLEGQTPTEVCKDCGQSYHPGCIRAWLRYLPDTKHSFDTLFGRCPACQSAISVTATASSPA